MAMPMALVTVIMVAVVTIIPKILPYTVMYCARFADT